MSNTLDIANIVDVSVVSVPSNLLSHVPNNLAILTHETPSNNNEYGIYLDSISVGKDYGTKSLTYQLAVSVFSQPQNILSADGSLVIVPLQSSVSATFGYATSESLTNNLYNIILVSNGSLQVSLNGLPELSLTGLNFTRCTTLTDVVNVIQGSLPDAFVTLVVTESGGYGIEIQSKVPGSLSTVTVTSGIGGTNLLSSTLLGTSFVSTTGVDSSGETILSAIDRVANDVYFTGVITTLTLENSAVETASTGVNSLDKMFLYATSSIADIIGGLGLAISSASETQTRILGYTQGVLSAKLMAAAYASLLLSVDFTGSNTALTMNLKNLVGITPDIGITQTIYDQASTSGVDLYVSYGGVSGIFSTVGNDFADNVFNKLALKLYLQQAYFNYLKATNTKVPQTEVGMNGLKGALANVLNQFVNNGVTGVGLQWNSVDTFGNPQSLRNSITQQGWYMYSIPIAYQSETQRITRKAPLIQIADKFSGAIQSGTIFNLVEY
jgi:hypothetical protein